MAFASTLKTLIDQPVWEWSRFAPTITAKPSAATSDWQKYFVGGTPRYAYYLSTLAFYRYDTWSDSWHQLASPTIASPSYNSCLEYCPAQGYYGQAIGPGPAKNTIQMAGLQGDVLTGNKILIVAGTGAGQERNIVESRDVTIHDAGSVSGAYAAGPSPATITDTAISMSRKTWLYNQWRDYQLRITTASGTNTGANQTRKILYNTNSLLAFSDYTFANITPWYAAPLSTTITAFAAWYQIESNIIIVDKNWDVPPDSTSRYVVKGGGLWLYYGQSGAPYYALQYYDILADVWYIKGSQATTLYSNTWDLYESSIEPCTESEGGVTTDGVHTNYLTNNKGTVSTGYAPFNRRVLIDSGQSMRVNQYANQMIKITGGKGRGQTRKIIGNSTDRFVISRDWDVIPTTGSTYQVIGDSDKIYMLPGRNQGCMGEYSLANDVVTTGRQYDFGTTRTFYADLSPLGIATVTIGSATATSGAYHVGDVLTLTNNALYYGIGGKVVVTSVAGNDLATVAVFTAGVGYGTSTTAYATTNGGDGGGNGAGATIVVSSNAISFQPPIGITGITRAAQGLFTVAVNAGGTGYSVGDILTVGGGDGNGKVRVTSVTGNGVVSGLALEQQGATYSNATGAATTFTTSTCKNGATTLDLHTIASGCTVNTTITDVATATTGITHNLKIGDLVNIGGCEVVATGAAAATTGATYLGGLHCVAGVPSATTFTYAVAGPLSSTAAQITPAVGAAGGCLTAVINNGGTGGAYKVGDVLTFNTTGSGGTARVVAINGSQIAGITLLTPGTGYSTSSNTTSGNEGGGNGTGASVTLTNGTGIVTAAALTITAGGQGFGIPTGSGVSTTYVAGTKLAKVSIYSGGIGYAVGDLLAVSGSATGGSGGVLKVLTVTPPAAAPAPVGAVLTAQLMAFGDGYSTGTQVSTSNLGNVYAAGFCGGDGFGVGCTVNIDAVGTPYATSAGNGLIVNVTSVNASTGAITAATACGGYSGMEFSGSGYTASAQTLVSTAGAVLAGLASAQTFIVDLTKNWIPNELVGKLIQTQIGGNAQTAQMRRIQANSAFGIFTGPNITAPTLGSTKYVIFDNKSLGTEMTVKPSLDQTQYVWGVATGGTASTLIDNPTGIATVKIDVGGSGYGLGDTITVDGGSPLATLKVVSVNSGSVTDAWVTIPGNGYAVSTTSSATTTSSPGTGCTVRIVTLNGKNWDLNRWAGYKVKIIAGTGSNANPNEFLIGSNTTNTLTLATNWSFVTNYNSSSIESITAASTGTAASVVIGVVNTEVTTDGDGNLDNVTLANGTIIGQIKNIYCKSVGNINDSLKITLTTPSSTISLGTNPLGKSVTLTWTGGSSGWVQSAGIIPDSTTVYAIMDNWGACCGQTTNGGVLTSATVGTAGTGYRVGDILAWGTGVGGFCKVLTVSNSTGGLLTVVPINPGSGYTAAGTPATTNLTNNGSSNTATPITNTVGTAAATTLVGDYYQNWGSHGTAAQSNLVNKYVRIVAGTPVSGLDSPITSVSATAGAQQLTIAALGSTTDGNCAYSIIGSSSRGPNSAAAQGGPSLNRLFGTTHFPYEKCRYMISWRGNNTPSIDRYDITQDMWETLSSTPLSELLNAGSMWVYNGKDRIYYTTSTTGRVQYYDFVSNDIVPCSTTPYVHGTAIPGIRMFVMSSSDLFGLGYEYIYTMRHSGLEMWRALIYW